MDSIPRRSFHLFQSLTVTSFRSFRNVCIVADVVGTLYWRLRKRSSEYVHPSYSLDLGWVGAVHFPAFHLCVSIDWRGLVIRSWITLHKQTRRFQPCFLKRTCSQVDECMQRRLGKWEGNWGKRRPGSTLLLKFYLHYCSCIQFSQTKITNANQNIGLHSNLHETRMWETEVKVVIGKLKLGKNSHPN